MTNLMTAKEAAPLLKVSPLTLCRWARLGKIKAYHLGDLWRFSEQQIQDFLDMNGG